MEKAKQELPKMPKPQGKIKQVIIKKTEQGIVIKHYGNPAPEEINVLLAMHAVAVFEKLSEALPESSPEAIKKIIVGITEFAIDVSMMSPEELDELEKEQEDELQ